MAGVAATAPALRGGAAELVAGLLRALFLPADTLTPDEARAALADCLNGATVRSSAERLAAGVELDDYRRQVEQWPATWRAAEEGDAPFNDDVLRAGWEHLSQQLKVAGAHGRQAALRLRVRSIPEALAVRALGERVGQVVAPFIDAGIGGGQWRWPLRVGVVRSASTPDFVAQIASSRHADVRDKVRPVVVDGVSAPVDVLITDQVPPDGLEVRAGVVIVLGDPKRAGDLDSINEMLDIGVDYHPAAVLVAPTRSLKWFGAWVAELAHDWPLDVATAMTVPGAVVLGDPDFLNHTAPRAWVLGVVNRFDAVDTELAQAMSELVTTRHFLYETQGSTDISKKVRAGEKVRGAPIELLFRGPQAAMAGPPDQLGDDEGRGAGDENWPPDRRLQTLVRDAQGNPRPDGFVRGTTMQLRVRIAAEMQAGAIIADAAFVPPVPNQPVDLHVLIAISGVEKAVRRTLHLPAEADSAWTRPIPLNVPNRRGVLDVFVVVQFKGRTVQSARLTGKILTKSAKIGPEGLALSVDVSSVVDQAPDSTQRTASKASLVELPPVKGKPQVFDAAGKMLFDSSRLDQANRSVHKELRGALAKRHADLPSASVALTRLAIHGSLLRKALGNGKPFFDDDPWVHITSFDSMHIPFELIYTHPQPSPREGVPICQPALDGVETCSADCVDRKRSDRVCPFAFWATSKVVERRRHVVGRAVTTAAEQRVVDIRTDAVVAVTSKADAKDPTASKRIHDAVGKFANSTVVANAWQDVEQAAAANPSLLVWVTHTILPEDPDDTLDIDLELSGSLLPVIDVGPKLVHPGDSEPGPVVLALGCSTEHLAASFSSYEAQLFGAAAEVVVTAICEIPGRGVADFVERLILAFDQVLTNGPGPHRFGQAMTQARRTTIRTGDLFALALTSAGDGDVQLKG